MDYYVYILASRRNGTLYIGVTNNLIRRVYEHKEGFVAGFTKRYRVKTLVWFDSTSSIHAAITREKQLKNWPREWKLGLIEESNPGWRDLYEEIVGAPALGPGASPGRQLRANAPAPCSTPAPAPTAPSASPAPGRTAR